MNPNNTLIVTSPFDGHIIKELATASLRDVEGALQTAHRLHQQKKSRLSLEARLQILNSVATLMELEITSLAKLIALEGGKPIVDARVEVRRAIEGVRCCVDVLRTQAGRVIPMQLDQATTGKIAFTQYEPIGVVVAVSAFNHPLNLIVHQVAPAIATGCPVIVKPAADTPLSCLRFIELLYQAGLAEEWCRALVIEDLDVAEALVSDSRVALFNFIGSAKVGWSLRRKTAPGTRCILEHGGLAPVLVYDDADLELATEKLLKGAYYHAGQVCVSVQRIFAHRNIADELANRMAQRARRLVVGDPLDEATEVGPLIRPRELARVADWVADAASEGAHILCGGERFGSSCFLPTLATHVPENCSLNQHEIFGPVALIQSFDRDEDAFSAANRLPFAFQAAVFTQRLERMTKAYHSLDGSAVMVNDHTAFRCDWMPFAGLKQSGLGIGGIPYTVHEMQVEKMLVLSN